MNTRTPFFVDAAGRQTGPAPLYRLNEAAVVIPGGHIWVYTGSTIMHVDTVNKAPLTEAQKQFIVAKRNEMSARYGGTYINVRLNGETSDLSA